MSQPSPPMSASRSAAVHWLPGFQLLRHYQPAWLRHDLVAGLVLTPCWCRWAWAMPRRPACPPSMACTLRSPCLSMPSSDPAASCAGTGFVVGSRDPAVILPWRPAIRHALWPWPARWPICGRPDLHRRRTGALGFITELLSKPIRYGYMNGIALTVLVSQLPKLFGISSSRRRPAGAGTGVRAGAVAGAANSAAFWLGATRWR